MSFLSRLRSLEAKLMPKPYTGPTTIRFQVINTEHRSIEPIALEFNLVGQGPIHGEVELSPEEVIQATNELRREISKTHSD